jgi:hypothetical protein
MWALGNDEDVRSGERSINPVILETSNLTKCYGEQIVAVDSLNLLASYEWRCGKRAAAGRAVPGRNLPGANHDRGGIATMQRIILYVHQALAWVVLVSLLLQFYWAGMALFGATSFEFHRTWGYLLVIPILLLLVLALAGRLGPGRSDRRPGDAALAPVQRPVSRRTPRGQRASPFGGERRYRPCGSPSAGPNSS